MIEQYNLEPETLALFDAACSGTITAEQVGRLEAVLRADDRACNLYLDYMRMHAALARLTGLQRSRDNILQAIHRPKTAAPGSDADARPFAFDAEQAVALPIIIVDAPGPSSPSPLPSPYLGFLGTAYHGVTGYIGDHDWAKGILGGTVFLVLLFVVLGSIEIISRWRQANRPQPQDNQVVKVPAVRAAQLTGAYDCRWTGKFRPPVHEVLNVNDYINLASGLAEVTYDSGAKVLLQGPCTYRIESPSSGYLQVGRMTAKVGERGEGRGESAKPQAANPKSLIPNPSSLSTTHYPLFTINTPTATVTDLGTEFGVDVDGAGATDSLVFVGSVKVNTVVGDGQKQAGELTLIENQSARVEQQGGKRYIVRRVAVKSENFVRPDQIQDWLAMAREAAAKRKQEAEKPKEPEAVDETPKNAAYLDLVDIVAGGDGHSAKRNAGIDPTTGQATAEPPSVFDLRGDERYHRVEGMPFVDGVFVPWGDNQSVQLDSAGHEWRYFGRTDNMTYGYIWAGGTIPTPAHDRAPNAAVLGGIDYAAPGHGVLGMPSNKGITFDLEAICRANPGAKLTRFLAMTGNTDVHVPEAEHRFADVWVFVDGKSRFQCREINASHGVFEVVVPLADGDRFLTLASSDAGDTCRCDWIVFGDPRLEMVAEPKETENRELTTDNPNRGGSD